MHTPSHQEFPDSPTNAIESPPELSSAAITITRHLSCLNFDSASEVEPEFLGPLLGIGDFGNLSGPPGCGKTTIAADIIMAGICPEREGVALGGLFRFDLMQLGDGKIAIIDAENHAARWSSLLRRKIAREGLDLRSANRDLVYFRPNEGGLHVPQHWRERSKALAEALAAKQVRFVVGDTLGMIWGSSDINITNWVQEGFAPFRFACQQYGITCLMLTHVRRKTGRNDSAPTGPIGSSFQEGQTDTQIMAIRTKLNGRHILKLTLQKSRRAFWIQSGAAVSVGFNGTYGYEPLGNWESTWPMSFQAEHDDDFDSAPRALDKIRAIFESNPGRGFSSQEISDLVEVTSRTVSTSTNKLHEQGLITRTGNGPSTRWRLK